MGMLRGGAGRQGPREEEKPIRERGARPGPPSAPGARTDGAAAKRKQTGTRRAGATAPREREVMR